MKNVKNIFTLLVVALVGLSLTGCSEDNLDTNPYSKSGVNIVGFGPSPILRTHEIRITGTNMNKVTKVIFPGDAIVERSGFNSSDAENIYVNVPDESVPGQIRLVAGNDTVTSVSKLTFEEPIEVTSVSPTTGLSAGDEITIRGEYVYNIAEVVFTSGVTGAPVPAEEFTYVSRKEIRLRVPLAAESGVITMNDGAEWELEWKEPLQILSATYASLSPVNTDFGQTITITGSNLHTVETVMFPGGSTSDFTVSADRKTITTTVPAETKPGAITLVLYSGAALTTDEFTVPTIAITGISKDKDLKVGDQVVLTGENFDRITKVTLPGVGEFSDYTISGNTLTFTVPEGMTDGKMELTQNSLITATQVLMMHTDAAETTIWAGEFVCSGWNGNQDLAWGGFDWTTIAPGSKVNFYYKKNTPGAWGCISLRHGDNWGNLPNPPIPGQYDLDEDEGVLSVVFTQEVLDDLLTYNGLVLTGDNYTLTKITIPSAEQVLWSGELDFNNWGINWQVGDGTAGAANPQMFVEAGLKAGMTIRVYLDAYNDWWQVQFFDGHWGGQEEIGVATGLNNGNNVNAGIYNLAEHNGCIEIKATATLVEQLTTLTDWGYCWIMQGEGCRATKITVE